MSTTLSFPTIPPSLRRNIRCAARAHNLDHLRRVGTTQNIRRRAPPTGLWDRFPAARTVQQMIETMDRIMEDPVEPAAVSGELNGYRRGGRTPWEIRGGEGEFKMRFDMPGMVKRDVRVWVEDGMLVIKAEKAEGEEGEWPAANFGRYNSRIALPENVVAEKIAAEVRDGVLYVTLPIAEHSSKVLDVVVK